MKSKKSIENTVNEYYGLTFYDPHYNPGKELINEETIDSREKRGKTIGLEKVQAFYSASSPLPTEKHKIPLIDGRCGFDSVERIINDILKLSLLYAGEDKDNQFYILMEKNYE